MEELYRKVAELITNAKHTTVFTGAGVSVESGVPPFRGKNGLWLKYNPKYLDLNYFINNPNPSWIVIKEVFYDFFGSAEPNNAHKAIAELEAKGLVNTVITQNIDNLHQLAGSKNVIEYHGNSSYLICLNCQKIYKREDVSLLELPVYCKKCGGLLKPDFVFFGESIPEDAHKNSILEAEKADVLIVIGTTGEVMPAGSIPHLAKQNNCTIVEINPEFSNYTHTVTDIFIQEKAGVAMKKINTLINTVI